MKMLLDENIPFRLYKDFPPAHEVYSVKYMGWSSYTNGDLLRLMTENNFEALITWDQNIGYQQNFKAYPITVFIFHSFSNDYSDLKPLLPKLLSILQQGVKPGAVIIS